MNIRNHIADLVGNAYSTGERETYSLFSPDKPALSHLAAKGNEVVENFPCVAFACTHMTALWTIIIRDQTDYPIHMVAGALRINNRLVFGDTETTLDPTTTFTESTLDFDGHCWVMFGEYIGDISIFRTAYSDKAPAFLNQAVTREFGAGRGFMIDTYGGLLKSEFEYIPQFVLTDDQVSALGRGALSVIQSGKMDLP